MNTTFRIVALCALTLTAVLLSPVAQAAQKDTVEQVLRTLEKVILVIDRAEHTTSILSIRVADDHGAVMRLERDLDEGRDPFEVIAELEKISRDLDGVERALGDVNDTLIAGDRALDDLGSRAKQLRDRPTMTKVRAAMRTLENAHDAVQGVKLDIAATRDDIDRVEGIARR